jgi:hypothetical protein
VTAPGAVAPAPHYSRRVAARDAGVSPEGTGSHRTAIGSEAGTFTDPDGFEWDATSAAHAHLGKLAAQV